MSVREGVKYSFREIRRSLGGRIGKSMAMAFELDDDDSIVIYIYSLCLCLMTFNRCFVNECAAHNLKISPKKSD